VARLRNLKSKLFLRLQTFFSKSLNRDQLVIRFWFPIVAMNYLLYMVHPNCGISSLLKLRVQSNLYKPDIPEVYSAFSLGIRDRFPGDLWIRFSNGYFEVFSFFNFFSFF
jgi:hypothetical protein